MKYMMFVVVDPDAAAEAEPSEDDLTIEQWLADVDGRGKRITGDALRPVSDATTVSHRSPRPDAEAFSDFACAIGPPVADIMLPNRGPRTLILF